ncbi:hypothetical protein BJX70DRAFT_6862 [Aspergillus crustosus]
MLPSTCAPHSEQDVHTGLGGCILCRQGAEAGAPILDFDLKRYTAPIESKELCIRCASYRSPELWFHPSCYSILASTYPASRKPRLFDLKQYAAAVAPLYPDETGHGDSASVVREGLLSSSTRDICQGTFAQSLFKRFPVEIQMMVSDYIGSLWFLILLGQTSRTFDQFLITSETPQCERIDLAKAVYITQVNYQGHTYVSRISGSAAELPESGSQLRLTIPSALWRVVVSLDHNGVRQIQFIGDDSKPRRDTSPWYEVINTSSCGGYLYAESDGLFLRSFRAARECSIKQYTTWKTPDPPGVQPWNMYSLRTTCRLEFSQVSSNRAGLLVCCTSVGTVGIHDFSGNSKGFDAFAKLMNRRVPSTRKYWLFCPISDKEILEDAWVRQLKGLNGAAAQPFLILRTSLGRVVTFGPQPSAELREFFEYRSLRAKNDGPVSGIVHDTYDPQGQYNLAFGITCAAQSGVKDPDTAPPFPIYKPPPIPPGAGSPANSWFMTAATLDSVRSVQICRDQQQDHRPCIGLILRYADGHTEAVGQIRWDRELSPDIHTPIQFHCSSIGGKSYVKSVTTGDSEDDKWQRLPEKGKLVWWLGHLGDELHIHRD